MRALVQLVCVVVALLMAVGAPTHAVHACQQDGEAFMTGFNVEQIDMNSAIIPPTSDGVLYGNNTCLECVKNGTHIILKRAVEHIIQFCQNTTCPFLKDKCEYLEQHPNRTLGYLVGKLRPGIISFAYCKGAGQCKKNESVSSIFSPTSESDASVYQQADAAAHLLDAMLQQVTFTMQWAALKQKEPQISQIIQGGRNKCKKCLHKVTKATLKHSLLAIAKVCKHTECPRMKKVCEWIKHHKDFVRGLTYEKVRPWEVAVGWCYGDESCKHPDDMKPHSSQKEQQGRMLGRIWERRSNSREVDEDEAELNEFFRN